MASLKEIFDREIRQIALQSDKGNHFYLTQDVEESFTRLQMNKSTRSDQPHPSDTLTSTIPCPQSGPPCPEPYIRANSPSCLTNVMPLKQRGGEELQRKVGIGGSHVHTLSLCDHETTLPSDGCHSTKYLRNNTGNVITPSSHFFGPNSQTPNVFIASPIDHHCTSGISESFPLHEECCSSSRFNLENGNTSPRDGANIVKNSLSLQFSGLNIRASDQEWPSSVHRKNMRKSKAERCDRTLRVDELERQNSAREGEESKVDRSSIIEEETEQITIGGESQILVEGQDRSDLPPQESETTLNIYDDEVEFAASGSKQHRPKEMAETSSIKEASSSIKSHRLPRWDDTSSETYSALKSLIQQRAKSEVEMDRIKSNKDILFVHKQDAIRMANRFKRTINSLLDGQKDRFGEECDFQLREKCKSPNSSSTSGLHGRSVVMYNSTYTGGGDNSSTKLAFDSKKYSTIGDFKRQERSCHSAAPTISASRYSSVEKEQQDNRYSTTSERSFEEIEKRVQEEDKKEEQREDAYNPLQVESVMNIQSGARPHFQNLKKEGFSEGPLSSPFELTMNDSNDARNESVEVGGAHQIMSYQELEELRGSTARNKMLRSGSQYSFKTPTFEHQFRAQSSANSRGLSGSSYQFNRRPNSRKDGWQSLGNTLTRAQSAQLKEPIQQEVSHRSPDLVREIDFLKSNERMLRQSLEAMTLEFHGKQRLNEELEEELNMKDERIIDLEGKLARANRKKIEGETEHKRRVDELRKKLRMTEQTKNALQDEIERLNVRLREKRDLRMSECSGNQESKQLRQEVQLLMDEVNKRSREHEKCKSEKQEIERKLSELTFLVENKTIELSRLHEMHESKEMKFRENKIKLEAELRIMREHVSDLKTKLDVAQQQIQIKENECQNAFRKIEGQMVKVEEEKKDKAHLQNLVQSLNGELKAAHQYSKEVEMRFKQAAQLVQTQYEAQVRNEYQKIDSIKGAIIQEVQNYQVVIQKLKEENEHRVKEINDLKKVEPPTSNDSLIRAELEVTYREKLAETERVISELRSENESLRETQETLRSAVDDVKQKSTRYEDEVEELKAESQRLKEKLNKKKQKLKGEREAHLAEKENLNSNLKNVLEVTQKERVQSQLKSRDESTYLKEIERLKINEINMTKQMKGMSEELNLLNSKYSSTASQCKQLLQQMSTLKESKQELERSVSHYSTSIRCTRNELSRQEENQGYLLDTIAKYKAEVLEKEERIVQIEGLLKSQRVLSQEMKSMLSKQKMLSTMKEEKEEKLQKKVEDLSSKTEKMEGVVGQKSREIHKLKIQYQQLEIGYGHLKEKLVEENQKNNDLEEENEALKEQVNHLHEQVNSLVELNQKNKDLREEKSVLMSELESKNQQCLHEYFELFAEGKMDSILDGEQDDINERVLNMIPTKER